MTADRQSLRVRQLLERGVVMPQPDSVWAHDDINPSRFAPGVIIHPGCRLSGAQTSMGPGCVIGSEAPATIENCELGFKVALKGGYFAGSTFLDGTSMGSAAHVRPGTLMEEESSGAHAVGFKQTILFPFVTAGSLINFCDALMAGGTSRKNHSEIGSSYIHFNFTPHHDKATASLIGDVPRGVMLDQPPVFLGGQGGLVGPARIGFGCVIPAGVIQRQDALMDGVILHPQHEPARQPGSFQPGVYRNLGRIVANSLAYIGNIRALQAWYRFVRQRFMSAGEYHKACYVGALNQLNAILNERIKRLGELADRMPHSIAALQAEKSAPARKAAAQQETFRNAWPEWAETLAHPVEDKVGRAGRETFLAALERSGSGMGYVAAIQNLDADAKKAGTAWLQAVVDTATAKWQTIASVGG